MPGEAPHQMKAVTFGPAAANQTQLTPSVERYSLKPSWFVALLVRDNDGRRYRTVAASPIDGAPGPLNADNKLLVLARLLGKPLDIAPRYSHAVDENGSLAPLMSRPRPAGEGKGVPGELPDARRGRALLVHRR